MADATTPGPDGRSLSAMGALVFVVLLAAVAGSVWYAQRWIEDRSDEWAIAAVATRLENAHLEDSTRAALQAEVDRLAVAFQRDEIEYDALFACVQRLMEGTLVPAAEAQLYATELDATDDDAARLAFQRLARAIRVAPTVPLEARELLASLRAQGDGQEEPRTPAAAGPDAAEIADLHEAADEAWAFDPVADFRTLVDGTLAGSPPERLPQR